MDGRVPSRDHVRRTAGGFCYELAPHRGLRASDGGNEARKPQQPIRVTSAKTNFSFFFISNNIITFKFLKSSFWYDKLYFACL